MNTYNTNIEQEANATCANCGADKKVCEPYNACMNEGLAPEECVCKNWTAANPQEEEVKEICGNCQSYQAISGDIGQCMIQQVAISRVRPSDDCIDWNPMSEDVTNPTAIGRERRSTLQSININKIYPHPDNPRKDLGDLTELAESIKVRGILQNLTLVPRPEKEGEFLSVIGHRRLAAARLAGLTEVPCVVSDMDHREQVATMLLENIQRSELTPIEQAQGFQMMMDLGETITGISEKTGFSDGTIRKRLNLVKLDQKKLQESFLRGGTLMDYAELEKLQSEKLKNKVLEHIGTDNFKWQLRNAIEEEGKPVRKAELLKELKEFAQPCKNSNGLSYVNGFYNFNKNNWKKPSDANKMEYFYLVEGNNITLYKKEPKASPKKKSAAEKAFAEREAQLKDLTKRAYESRYEFVKGFNAGKKSQKEIMAFVMQKLLIYGRAELDDLLEMLNIEKPKRNEESVMGYTEQENHKRDLIQEKYEKQPERVSLMAAYLGRSDSKTEGYYFSESWNNKIKHRKNDKLDNIYDTLISLGYEISDEEQQLRDGSHELFDKPKDGN